MTTSIEESKVYEIIRFNLDFFSIEEIDWGVGRQSITEEEAERLKSEKYYREKAETSYEEKSIYECLLERRRQIDEMLIKSISSAFYVIGEPIKLKILLALRTKLYLELQWTELVNVSKIDIDILIKQEFIEESDNKYRITESGLGLLDLVDTFCHVMKEVLEQKEEEERRKKKVVK